MRIYGFLPFAGVLTTIMLSLSFVSEVIGQLLEPVRVQVNCLHTYGPVPGFSNLHSCKIKALVASTIIPENNEQLTTFSNPLANVNLTAKIPENVTNPSTYNTNITTNSGAMTIDSTLYDIVELICEYDGSTSEISNCEVLAIIQMDPENRDQIKINQNSLFTLNVTGRLPINSTTLLPYNNSNVGNE